VTIVASGVSTTWLNASHSSRTAVPEPVPRLTAIEGVDSAYDDLHERVAWEPYIPEGLPEEADLASACITGTGVAADQGTQVPKPRGADQKTRATRTRRKTGAGRAGGEIPQQRAEARDRRQGTEALTLW
jgi:hypothetical protein